MDPELVSIVWLIHDALAFGDVDQGRLILKEDKISFLTPNGELFNVPLAEMKAIKWPFYEFGLCFTTVINGKKYRFIFSDPSGAKSPVTAMEKVDALMDSINVISTGKEAANKWKAVFGKL